MKAFVRWGERAWPPTSAEATALATVLVDVIGAGAFEAFLALVTADSRADRGRLLRYAGASTNLDEYRELLGEEPDRKPALVDDGPQGIRTTSDEGKTWLGKGESGFPPERGRVPLYQPGDLVIEGIPVAVYAELTPGGGGDGSNDGGGGGRGGGYGHGATDLTELDAVGMWVALNYERHRLRLAGVESAESFVAETPVPTALVFDVSSDRAIRTAAGASGAFRAAFERLAAHGVSREWPGFDILTLDPTSDDGIGRMIELKSSGVDAQTQSMTWIEWATARDSQLRQRFYLYLVNNLRSDLGDRVPHIQAVQDPFGALWAQTIVETTHRTVQFDLRQFDLVLDLPLRVKADEARLNSP